VKVTHPAMMANAGNASGHISSVAHCNYKTCHVIFVARMALIETGGGAGEVVYCRLSKRCWTASWRWKPPRKRANQLQNILFAQTSNRS